MGGRLKSFVLGGTNPGPGAAETNTDTPFNLSQLWCRKNVLAYQDDVTLLAGQGKPKPEDSPQALLPSEAEPDQVDRGAHPEEAANEQEPVVAGVEPVIEPETDSAPDEQAREQVSEDGPECALFIRCHNYPSKTISLGALDLLGLLELLGRFRLDKG